ncbi:MAG: hypothetical protein Q9167_007779 [Letrouitia subvulpina]
MSHLARIEGLFQAPWTITLSRGQWFPIMSIVLLFSLVFLWEAIAPHHLDYLFERDKRRLPPGPSGYPLIGNLVEWRYARQSPPTFIQYLSSLASYGDMTTLHMGSRTWVLLNSPHVVSEIISKRGKITHERPRMPIASDIISRAKRVVLLPTSEWMEGRRVMQHMASASAIKAYTEMQELESVQMLANHLFRPKDWFIHHYRYSNSVMHRIILGEGIVKSTPELVELQRITIEFLKSIGDSIIDYFPQLTRLPTWLQVWRQEYEMIGQVHHDVFETWWRPIKQMVDQGMAPPSFARNALLHPSFAYKGDDEQAMYLAMSAISAGSDNTRMILNVLVMVALCYPDVIHKVREEADTICGAKAERLPLISDIDSMPYTCAVIKEALRWRPIIPLVPPHVLTEELTFEGYYFPAGTEFLINAVPVCNAVEESDSFRPERWLNGNEASIGAGLWIFGGGRRTCVGYKLAQTQIFAAFTRLNYCFDYSPAGNYNSHQLQHHVTTEPFPIDLKIRSQQHEKLIIEEATRAGCLEVAKIPF